jgi:alanine racemase
LEVDLVALRANIDKTLSHLAGRCRMMPTVKANAYGMGLTRVARVLTQEFRIPDITVAQVYEGLRLRAAGETCGLLVMGAAPAAAIPAAVEADLILTVFQAEMAEKIDAAARAAGKTAAIHITIDTGMNRLGVRPGPELDALLTVFKALRHLRVAGIFTHFATSDNRRDIHTMAQFEGFQAAVAQARAAGFDFEYVHCCNSGAIIWYDAALDFSTHCRPGSLYMGYDMMADRSNPLGVREVMSWRAGLTNIHWVQPGEAVGYSRRFQPAAPTRVGTVGVGYGDGLFRPMATGYGPVLVGDTRTRYLGSCMDQCFVDVTGIDCAVGDEVTIVGYSRGGALLSAFDIEDFTGQCYQNALTSINDRVCRIYRE